MDTLSPATPALGYLDFIRATHEHAILPQEDTFDGYNLFYRGQAVKVEEAEDDKATDRIQPGQMSLHHGLTIHGLGPNALTIAASPPSCDTCVPCGSHGSQKVSCWRGDVSTENDVYRGAPTTRCTGLKHDPPSLGPARQQE
ncbi:hypothetical protein SAMN04488002_3234 [Litoreibacter janthinus]|uniref:Uncharacterized protein n=1 Tax=Litoreibacter janthinus TaxID=670154 RepID=A0A1I6HQ01_9RHOB|nr:hypothetical protein SAMN04488002_3234 [Litoreibacter janthinus]